MARVAAHGPARRPRARSLRRNRWTASLVVLSACAACSTATSSGGLCEAGAPYRGAPLRDPLPPAALALEPGPTSDLSNAARGRLQEAFDRAVEATGATTLTVAAWKGGGSTWTATHGPVDGRLHSWASVGKMVTAAAILRLEAAGRLSLDDTVADWLDADRADAVPFARLITLRMLLDHTSGLFSVNEDPRVRADGGPLDLDGVLDVLDRQPPYACPGTAWRYTNTGYALLGAVIERATGRPYAEAATELVLSRSDARNVRILRPDGDVSGVVPPDLPPGEPPTDVRAPQAAGGAVADAESMAILLRDLLAGEILPRATVARMLATLYPMHQQGLWYGLGLMAYDVPGDAGPTLWVGHSGGLPGARAVVAFVPALDAIVTVALTGQGSSEAVAAALLSALDP